ncbi:MAG: M1 family metallopeptidase [Nannocystaceae bacterium]
MLAATLAACARSRPDPMNTPVAEPTQALREPSLRGVVPASARIADYRIDARLDTERKRVEGQVRVTWRNRTSRQVRRLRFHQYMNAFRADDTLWLRHSGDRHRSQVRDRDSWGYLDIREVHLLLQATPSGGGDAHIHATARRELRWSEDTEPSTMTVHLPQAVAPGQSVSIEIDFITQLPRVFARTGHSRGFFLVAHWYPKLGVLDDAQGWRAHPFSYYSEFYADFGDYDIHLDVPRGFKVGATGIRIEDSEDGDRRKLRYHAEMVHDFAWTAGTELDEQSADYNGIRIRTLFSSSHGDAARQHIDTQLAALASYEARFGPYPWSTITIVEPPEDAAGAQGMEYPTFFTTSTGRNPAWMPDWLFQERITGSFTTLHEFGHQYFQGMFASDEDREPWLDEGINTTSNVLALYDRYGADPWVVRLFGHTLSVDDGIRLAMHEYIAPRAVDRPASEFHPSTRAFHRVVYRKTAAAMLTLRNLVGHAPWDRALRAYAAQARFSHPTGSDLEQAFGDELGTHPLLARLESGEGIRLDLEHYFDHVLRGTGPLNFAVRGVDNIRRPVGAGWHRDAAGSLVQTERDPQTAGDVNELAPEHIEGRVVVAREGDLEVPVEIEFEFSEGLNEVRWWSGPSRLEVFTFPRRRVVSARIDPDRRYLFELRRNDNIRYAKHTRPPATAGSQLHKWTEMISLLLIKGASL